ncbi:MAG: acyltransferase family protein [Clostridia bacterium]|nr:acyltransferase family protein [Clostridia bacterium]MBR6512928.1 acyltransferase family protein [Clostridia bacterium]
MAETKQRLYLWDNVKALLIVLVVLGHFVTQFTGQSAFIQSIFLIIYSFHMPLFIFVSGLFSKSAFKNDRLNVNRVIAFVILFYLLKILIYAVHHPGRFRPFYESGIPWYMLAMAVWLVITFFLRKANPKIVIPVSVALALIIGYFKVIDSTFCISRIITFYPFFFLGYALDPAKVAEKTRDKRLRVAAGLLLAIVIVLAFLLRPALYLTRPILVAYHPYAKLWNPDMGILIRALWYAVSAIISFAVICVLPNSNNKLTYIGASTLPIYFFHRPILYLIMDSGLGEKIFAISPVVWLLCGVVLALILSVPQLNIPFNKLMKFEFIKRKNNET